MTSINSQAVSIHQFEDAAAAVAAYERALELGCRCCSGPQAPMTRPETGRGAHGMVVFGSDHGLCGRLNEEIAIAASRELGGADRCHLLVVGLRAAARLEAFGHPVDARLMLPGSVTGLQALIQTILIMLDRWRADRGVTRIVVCHN